MHCRLLVNISHIIACSGHFEQLVVRNLSLALIVDFLETIFKIEYLFVLHVYVSFFPFKFTFFILWYWGLNSGSSP
jgi:hypothetical protein